MVRHVVAYDILRDLIIEAALMKADVESGKSDLPEKEEKKPALDAGVMDGENVQIRFGRNGRSGICKAGCRERDLEMRRSRKGKSL